MGLPVKLQKQNIKYKTDLEYKTEYKTDLVVCIYIKFSIQELIASTNLSGTAVKL